VEHAPRGPASRPGTRRRLPLRRGSSAAIPDAPAGGRRTAVLLLSGGLDSGTCLALPFAWGWPVHAVSFDYGQRHRVELAAARRLARATASSPIASSASPVSGRSAARRSRIAPFPCRREKLGRAAIPVTYVPARNTLFLGFALAVAERTGATEIVIGANALDYSGYPDCRPPFLRAFEKAARLGTKAGAAGRPLTVRAPLLRMRKREIVRLAVALGLDPGLTSSCYDPDPDGIPCGECDSCLLREKGFREAGERDSARAPEGRR